MNENVISRKDFLRNSAKIAVGATAGIVGLNLITKDVHAENVNTKFAWPYPYTALDPEAVRLEAHHLYWNGMDCGTGVFGSLVNKLADVMPDPWSNIPIEILLFGRGGGAGWGSLCGTLNGAAALISLVVEKTPSTALINELWGWYTTEILPTDTANAITYVDQNYVGDLPQNIAGSPLCHVSVSQWCMVAGKKVGDVERKERCARLAGDIAAKAVEILNSYFDSTFVSTFTDPESNGSCLICHGSSASDNVSTHMECVTCHSGDPHAVGIKELGALAFTTTLANPYPNPFRNETNVEFSLLSKDKVRLEVYDMQGRLVKSLIDSDYVNPGTFTTTWRGDNNAGASVPSGIYLIKMTTGTFTKTVKVNLSK